MSKTPHSPKAKPPSRYAVGSAIRIISPGIDGTVIACDDERSVSSEYWHTVSTKYGDRKEPGCNLELIPPPIEERKPVSGKLADQIHFHGHNARLNVNSTDSSENTVSVGPIFPKLRHSAASIADEVRRSEIIDRIDALEASQGTTGFVAAYQAFITTASDLITVFGPFLPALAKLLPVI